MPQSPEQAKTLVEVINYWAKRTPNNEVLRFYPQGEGDYSAYNFAELQTRCMSIAENLKPYHGKRALLFYSSGLAFLEALFACFYAGVIAVPAYPPRRNHNFDRLQALIDDCQPSLVLSSSDVLDYARSICRHTSMRDDLPWLDSNLIANLDDEMISHSAASFSPCAEDLAFLQYTSGSTGLPKGVMISHANLMANIRMSQQAFALPEGTRCVSWLPLFHDMGLIGAVMMPLYWGAGAALMPPAAFLQKPLRWLQLISEIGQHSPVGSPAPNFAYQLCVNNIGDQHLANLDLSNWVFALNGAEPIRSKNIRNFITKFSAAGFNASTMRPSYGMAECTLVASTRQQHPLAYMQYDAKALEKGKLIEKIGSSHEIISSGNNLIGQELRIVHPKTLALASEGSVGEIWLKGAHIAQGYWQKTALSNEIFQAFTDDNQGPFLRTGDLGSVIKGELFITGRAKDLLIIRGKNHYPQDIECTVSHAHEALHIDHCAAFTTESNGEDQLVIIQEILRSHQKNLNEKDVIKKIRNAVAREHGIDTQHIVLIRFISLAKTSSGKIQRHIIKQQFIQQQLNSHSQWQANTEHDILPSPPTSHYLDTSPKTLALWIRDWLAIKADVDNNDISLNDAIDDLGIDSVDLIQLSGVIETWIGHRINDSAFFDAANISTAAERLLADARNQPNDSSDDEEIEGFI